MVGWRRGTKEREGPQSTPHISGWSCWKNLRQVWLYLDVVGFGAREASQWRC